MCFLKQIYFEERVCYLFNHTINYCTHECHVQNKSKIQKLTIVSNFKILLRSQEIMRLNIE